MSAAYLAVLQFLSVKCMRSSVSKSDSYQTVSTPPPHRLKLKGEKQKVNKANNEYIFVQSEFIDL